MGADDYVAKPFSGRELLARIKAVLRRTRLAALHPPKVGLPSVYQFGKWSLPARIINTLGSLYPRAVATGLILYCSRTEGRAVDWRLRDGGYRQTVTGNNWKCIWV